jgi:hypothetical protein
VDFFPDNCIRGIRKKDFLTPEGISSAVYLPDERTAQNREDGGLETSINWEDDGTVLNFTLRNPAYQWGVARLPRATIDYLNVQPASANALSYERAPLEGNPYHGNIVFRQNLSKVTRNMIAGTLALASTIFTQEKAGE